MNLTRIDLLFNEADKAVMSLKRDSMLRPPLRYEQLVRWAIQEWNTRYPDRAFVAVWAVDECANVRALQRILPGRPIKTGATYHGSRIMDRPFVVPINRFYMAGRKAILTDGVGAFRFSFKQGDEPFDVLYASTTYEDDSCGKDSIALVPPEYLDTWGAFQTLCESAAASVERGGQHVHVIGGAQHLFKPTVDWDQVILSEALKADLRSDLETFFGNGVDIYKQLNLPPFRKLLLVGPPGTGKSTLCAALAKLALNQKCIVVYVSATDKRGQRDGDEFSKIHQALRIVTKARQPALLIIEELDAYLNEHNKPQILNVLDGFESPNNPRGVLLLATTNYPEVIDERIAKRPGRMDRIIYIPPIQDEEQALRMLIRYMGTQWRDEHSAIAPDLVGQTGAFVREVAVYARLLAANNLSTDVSLDLLQQSLKRLTSQVSTDLRVLPRKQIGFVATEKAVTR